MTELNESHTCYLCRGYLHVQHDIVMADFIVIRKDLNPRELVPVHPWCKRQMFDGYEERANDPQATFAKMPRRWIDEAQKR